MLLGFRSWVSECRRRTELLEELRDERLLDGRRLALRDRERLRFSTVTQPPPRGFSETSFGWLGTAAVPVDLPLASTCTCPKGVGASAPSAAAPSEPDGGRKVSTGASKEKKGVEADPRSFCSFNAWLMAAAFGGLGSATAGCIVGKAGDSAAEVPSRTLSGVIAPPLSGM